MTTTEQRRDRQRQALVAAAERQIAARGVSSLKARELAAEIGCAVGAIYNLVQDLDELVLRVGSRTLARLDAALTAAGTQGAVPSSVDAREQLVAVAQTYLAFARANLQLWRSLFDHRMQSEAPLPDWSASEQLSLFRHVLDPLSRLLPDASPDSLALLSRTLFAAVHGVVVIGLDEKLVAVPKEALDDQIATLVRLVCAGLQSRQG